MVTKTIFVMPSAGTPSKEDLRLQDWFMGKESSIIVGNVNLYTQEGHSDIPTPAWAFVGKPEGIPSPSLLRSRK